MQIACAHPSTGNAFEFVVSNRTQETTYNADAMVSIITNTRTNNFEFKKNSTRKLFCSNFAKCFAAILQTVLQPFCNAQSVTMIRKISQCKHPSFSNQNFIAKNASLMLIFQTAKLAPEMHMSKGKEKFPCCRNAQNKLCQQFSKQPKKTLTSFLVFGQKKFEFTIFAII